MVTFQFAKNAKTVNVIADVYDKEQAQEIAEKHASAAFSALTSTLRAFDRRRGNIVLTGYIKRYTPFWHLIGESFFEYHRKSQYQIGVRPEVQSVTVNKKKISVQPEAAVCLFEGLDHCYENYKKEIVQDALKEKGKDYKKYLEAKSRTIRSRDSLGKKVDVLPLQIRASFLLPTLYKDLIKPIQADKFLDERVVVNKLAVFYAPVHVFEFKEENTEKKGTIAVDAVTGEWRRGESIVPEVARKYLSNDAMFDIGAEVAASLVPGAGVGVAVGRHLFGKAKDTKTEKKRKQLRTAYQSRKKKK